MTKASWVTDWKGEAASAFSTRHAPLESKVPGIPVKKFVSSFPNARRALPDARRPLQLKKFAQDQQIVWAEVYTPGFPDSQGDFMSAETIAEMAYEFLRKGLVGNIDLNHSRETTGSYVVESFIARKGDPDFIEGSWVIGVKVPDPKIWEMVKSGELNGFSLDGMGNRMDATIIIEMPEDISGETDEQNGHSHSFTVKYDADGQFIGGMTGPSPDGHVHPITMGTATDRVNDHSHRFSFVEGVLRAQAAH